MARPGSRARPALTRAFLRGAADGRNSGGKRPPPAAKRSKTLDAFAFGPSCMQNESFTGGGKSEAFSEDCLFLNIYRPAAKELSPSCSGFTVAATRRGAAATRCTTDRGWPASAAWWW